mgnify:FL=1
MKTKNAQPIDMPPWMDIAWHEFLLWQENDWTINNPEGQKRAQNYIYITRNYFKPSQAGWCGCFVDWVLKKTNQIYGTAFSSVTNNPSGSQNYATRKRYPGSIRLRPRLNRVPYGSLVVLRSGPWQGHVGFLVNYTKIGHERYACLLGGNQNDKVCVQEFRVYRVANKIFYQTRKGKIFTLKGYVFPQEYHWEAQDDQAFEYCDEGYEIVEAFEKLR